VADTAGSDASQPGTDVFRESDISYLRIPAPDAAVAASFYRAVFGWSIREDGSHPAFRDGTGHVIGHFMPDLAVAGEAGFLPYVSVTDLDATLERVVANGGDLVGQPCPEGDLWVATVHDPAGNVVGVWQRGRRSEQR
jgi:predicted enzyme related to lactoylglutathione lyase